MYTECEIKNSLRRDCITCRESGGNFYSFPKHWHSYYEIELVLAGRGIHDINGHQYPEAPGDVFIMRLNDCHSFLLEEEGRHLVVEVPVKCLPHDVEEVLMMVRGDVITHLENDEFQKLLTQYTILKDSEKEGAFNRMKLNYICAGIIMLILSYLDEDMAESFSQANLRLREIIAYIQKNLQTPLTLQTIADEFYISKEYLRSFFKKNAGISLTEYIRKVRLERAVELLQNTNMSVSEISEQAGFTAISSFMRLFKKEYETTPTELRRLQKMREEDI